jgi:hypothetical protein
MLLRDLQDQLRAHIRALLDRGQWTGTKLSQQAGFQQAHLSNFLNARRGLSLESMDHLLETLNLGVLDLVAASEIQRHTAPRIPAGKLESVSVVSAEQATRLPRFGADQISETISFKKSFLRRLRPNDVVNRSDWLRFVLIKLDAKAAAAVFPASTFGATLLVDRHYNSLRPYRRLQPNLYVVACNAGSLVGYVTVSGDYLLLRPRNPNYAVQMVRIERGRTSSHYIGGRVCHASMEV